ncbi:MAG: TrbI/VirB10 family protein [Bacteriovoracia bacterium]
MEDEKPTVEAVSLPTIKGQFGSGNLYRTQSSKKTGWKAWSALGALGIGILAILIKGNPNDSSSSSGGSPGTFQAPEQIVPSDAIELGTYSRVQDAQGQLEKQRAGPRSRMPDKLPGPQLVARPRNIKIPPGALVKSELITGGSNGPVKARLKEPLIVGGETFAEEGAVLLGSGSSTEERLFIRFYKLIFKDGSFTDVQAEAVDSEDQVAGLHGSKLGQYALKLAAGVGLNFFSGFSEALQDTEGQQGVLVKKASVKNALLNGASRASIEQSQEIMSGLKNKTPIIEVSAGTPILILFQESGS